MAESLADYERLAATALPRSVHDFVSGGSGAEITLRLNRAAFDALTPGRQRGYLLYFSAAKQSKTREARIEKCVQQILKGKGLND